MSRPENRPWQVTARADRAAVNSGQPMASHGAEPVKPSPEVTLQVRVGATRRRPPLDQTCRPLGPVVTLPGLTEHRHEKTAPGGGLRVPGHGD